MKERLLSCCLGAVAVWQLFTAAPSTRGQTNFTPLAIFHGTSGGPALPYAGVLRGTDGGLYGTTVAGGISNFGSVFRLNPDGTGFATLKSFLGANEGLGSYGGLALGTNGALYGTTYGGGTSNLGTVFKLDQKGDNFTVLHSFLGGADGANPWAGLLAGRNGAVYGTTYFANSATRGTVFRMDEDGSNYMILHNFTGNPDGQEPRGRLIESSDGRLYGTTVFGGSGFRGAVFSMDTNGGSYTVFSFSGAGIGGGPEAGVMEASDGVLYGTLYDGGSNSLGIVFALTKDFGSFVVLRRFTGANGDGKWPNTELVEGTDGALYGLTEQGGSANGPGTIFKLNKDGSGYTVLRIFDMTAGGYGPEGGFLKGPDGVFYGTTAYGGPGAGCVFALSQLPLPPRALSIAVSGGTNVVQFTGTSSIQYDVQRSADLRTWSPLGTFTAPLNGLIDYTDPGPPQPAAYYRLKQD